MKEITIYYCLWVKMVFGIVFITFSYACKEKESKILLEEALGRASSNQVEIQKVLDYYREDTVKYKAACFLIENMPGHYSYMMTPQLKEYLQELDSVLTSSKILNYEQRDTLYTRENKKFNKEFSVKVEDIQIVSSDYLIQNINHAFKLWTDQNWSKHLSFDDFCEYLLPYKVVEGQVLDNWREYCGELYDSSLAQLKYCSLYEKNACIACNTVTEKMRQDIFPRMSSVIYPAVKSMHTLLKIPHGTCEEYAIMTLAVMRAKGIPCTMDFTPQWPFRSMGHVWNVLLENTGKTSIFEGANSPVGTPHKKDHKMAKVYRNTYAANKELKELNNVETRVPELFQTPFMKDVTQEYMTTQDLFVPVDDRINNKYAYLCVFDNAEWIPVAWGKRKGNGFLFERMGKDIVYLPTLYTNREMISFSEPILLDISGKTIFLKADTINSQMLKLYRKHPNMPYSCGENLRLIGAKIQAANTSNFKDSITLHTYSNLEPEIGLTGGNKYQYWRYYSSHHGFVNVAELRFYERDSLNASWGRIIGIESSYRSEEEYRKEAVFDGDLLTYFDAPTPSDSWVGMDFGRPVDISRITCIMRGDGNTIEEGNEYELFFRYHKNWKSLGKKIGKDIFLTYHDCPCNALFLLRNLTKGKEERIFTYQEGKQEWW